MASSSSTKNPETNMSFLLTPGMVMKLMQPVEALCDPKYNPRGIAMLDVNDSSFEITVRNTITNVVGHLYLDTSCLIDFHCIKPIVKKVISLKLFHDIITEAAAKEARTAVFHLDVFTNNLSIKFGKSPDHREFAIEFLDVDAEFDRFPKVTEFCCEVVLENEILMEMIERFGETAGSLPVSIQLSEKQLAISVAQPAGPYRYLIKDENFEDRVSVKSGKEYIALFGLFHIEMMKKATSVSVSQQFHLRILTRPFGKIMIQFNIGKAGKLVFVLNASLEEP